MNISENDNALDLDLALEVRPYFRLNEKRAVQIIGEVKTAVANWQNIATKYHIPKSQQELKSGAFRQAER